MEHTETNSSNVKSYHYDPQTETLELRFRCGGCSGEGKSTRKTIIAMARGTDERENCSRCDGSGHTGTYSYSKVEPEVFEKFSTAPSIGKAFAQHIRGKYPTQKV